MANDLNEMVEVIVQDASVITVPIDSTLTHSNEAADAKAVGDALGLKADKSELQAAVTVNGQAADAQGHILVYGNQIQMDSSDTTTLKAKISAVDGKTAADIPVSSAVGAQKISEKLTELDSKNATTIPMSSGTQAQTIAQKIGTMDSTTENMANTIIALGNKGGDTIKLEAGGTQTIKEAVEERVLTVNGDSPDDNGNVEVNHTLTADNLTSSQSQQSVGTFVKRTSGGEASIQDGGAWLNVIRGNRVHVGYVPEVLNMTVNAAPREEGETPITAIIDRDVFISYVATSGTINLYYTTDWNEDPDLYGVTVTGTPISGDQIMIAYTKENRGTIIQSDPQSLVSTGYNLYNHDLGYAIGLKYSDSYGFKIDGSYTAVKYSSTLTGTKQTITPVDGYFSIPANGYIWVDGGNATDTEVYMTWSDWVMDRTVDFAAYSEDVIDLSDVMDEVFPYGLLRVGEIRDEINFNTGIATNNVQRLTFSAENLETAEATGRTYEYDTDYIYLERAVPVETEIDLDGQYSVSDHGLEFFTDTDIAVYAIMVYGNNLKNKLERDVVTLSAQELTTAQKNQVMDNIGVSQAIATLNGKITTLCKTTTETITSNSNGWVAFPSGRVVLNAIIKDTTRNLNVFRHTTGVYYASCFFENYGSSHNPESLSASTNYSITYVYIEE